MSFYGNTANTSQIQFQFDKIFPSRTEMDNAAILGTDNVFSGRFVLVKYDIDLNYFVSNLLVGFKNPVDNKIYQDKTFTIPYIYTTFAQVAEPILSEWNQYYYYDGKFYLKLPSEEYFVPTNKNYYKATWTPPQNFVGVVVGMNQIVRLRDNVSGRLETAYCVCTGGTIGQEANWDEYMFDDDYSDYLQNFNQDQITYGPAFDIRGYDATVWEKVYSEGHGRFILVARLNGGLFPELELHPDAPTQAPNNPYIDVQNSAESRYCIKVPSMYGFQIKPVDKEKDPNALSNELANITVVSYDEDTHEYVKDTVYTDVAIYYNKEGMSPDEYYMDSTTTNQVLIEPSGETGRTYTDLEGNETKKDLLELTVHLPAIGNMVCTGYDVIYGHKPLDSSGKASRLTDIEWVDGSEDELIKINGSTNRKSHEPNSLAGMLNFFHDRLGQIIVHLEGGMIAPEMMASNLIYEYEGRYYRKAKDCDIELIDDTEYTYEKDSSVTQAILTKNPNKYYVDSRSNIPAGSVPEAIATTTFDSTKNYYKRNLTSITYEPIQLESYIPGHYFLKVGDNYICDNSTPYPLDSTQKYYDITRVTTHNFEIEYVNNGTLFTLDESTGIFTPSRTDLPLPNVDYYKIARGSAVATNVRYYEPNVYYYRDAATGGFVLDKNSSMTDTTRQYFIVTFKDEIHPGVDINGNPIIYREMESSTPVNNLRTKPDANVLKTYYFQDELGRWIPYSYLAEMDNINGQSPYTILRTYYAINTNEHYNNDMFLPNVYYAQEEDGSYIKANTWNGDNQTDYYTINTVNELEHPFYIPNKYWYKENNRYSIDLETSKIRDAYFTRSSSYVYRDSLENCPHGYEWNKNAAYVPPSITLYRMTEKSSYVEIKGISNGENSINGAILNLHKEYDFDNEETRDETTFRGCLNKLKDMLYCLKELIPGEVLMVNDFGQVVSTGVQWETIKTKLNL